MDSLNFDLAQMPLRDLNRFLHKEAVERGIKRVTVQHPDGTHNIAVGLDVPIAVDIEGHAGYYAAGMLKHGEVTIHGNAGTGVAENMMSGKVHVKGFASVSAGASAHGGLLVVDGDASLRCGISLKGGDIVVGGSVGSFSGFMAQAGRMVICGNAGDALGDSLYEAVIYVRGEIKSLGADVRIEAMSDSDFQAVGELLAAAGFKYGPKEFKRVASAKSLYHWNADANQEY